MPLSGSTVRKMKISVGGGSDGIEFVNAVDRARIIIVGGTRADFGCEGPTVTINEGFAGAIILLDSPTPLTLRLPAPLVSGRRFMFLVRVAATAVAHAFLCRTANGATDKLFGSAVVVNATDTTAVRAFVTNDSTNMILLNGTTKGGRSGDMIEFFDVADGGFQVQIRSAGSGTLDSPFGLQS